MSFIPGEPMPPGLEEETGGVAEIQKIIQQYKGNALIGLEYAIELKESGREPSYLCVLCEKRGDPRTIMQHWTSYHHRLAYLNKHYPTVMNKLDPIVNKFDKMKSAVAQLTAAIEKHHGRLPVSSADADEFRRIKTKMSDNIKAKFHFNEKDGPNFVNVLDPSIFNLTGLQKRDIDSGKSSGKSKQEGLDEISSDSDGAHSGSKKSKRPAQEPAYRFVPNEKKVVKQPVPAAITEKPRNPNIPTPRELSQQAAHIAQERYKWEKYRCILEIQINQLEKVYAEYEKNPEKHPSYPEEWKAFWNRRYKELQKEKKVDPNKYDYRPEWAIFWSNRRKELFKNELDTVKKDIKKKLELSEDAEEHLERLKEKYKVSGINGVQSVSSPKKNERVNRERDDVIAISDEDSPRPNSRTNSRPNRRSRSKSPRYRYESKRSRYRSKSRSISPFSDEEGRRAQFGKGNRVSTVATRRYNTSESAGYYESSNSRYASRTRNSHRHYDDLSPTPPSKSKRDLELLELEDEGPLTFVAVLRLLTALEDTLGSLGPKMVSLLGKALALENVKANSSEDLLMNDDTCVFFETAKEKLKGLLMAEVIEDPQKIRAVKKAIKNIAALIHQVNAKGKMEEPTTSAGASTLTNKNIQKNVNIKELPFDRQLVASKLAAALVLHGREDLSTEDMDKLIYFFILLVKLSKSNFENEDAPLHIKDVAAELGIEKFKLTINHIAAAKNKPTLSNFVEELLDEDLGGTSNDKTEKAPNNDGGNSLKSLTDSDLQTLLQNFKHLSSEEQHHLIDHLKKLETSDPIRVEKLRKFINPTDLNEAAGTSKAQSNSETRTGQRNHHERSVSSTRSHGTSSSRHFEDYSPRRSSSKDRAIGNDDTYEDRNESDDLKCSVNPVDPNKFTLDDEDDDDYNFEDVIKAASSLVGSSKKNNEKTSSTNANSASGSSASHTADATKDPLTFNRAALNVSLSDTQNLIANLMGSLQQNNASKTGRDAPEPVPPVPPMQRNVPNQGNMQYYEQYGQQQQAQQQFPHPQQQQQYGQQGGFNNNANGYNQQMAYMGNDPAAYYNNNQMAGYNNSYQGYPQQGYGQQGWGNAPRQQNAMGYNMYGGN